MTKVKVSNQSEFEQVVAKMQKETGFKCNIAEFVNKDYCYLTTTTFNVNKETVICLTSDGSGSISCKKYLES